MRLYILLRPQRFHPGCVVIGRLLCIIFGHPNRKLRYSVEKAFFLECERCGQKEYLEH